MWSMTFTHILRYRLKKCQILFDLVLRLKLFYCKHKCSRDKTFKNWRKQSLTLQTNCFVSSEKYSTVLGYRAWYFIDFWLQDLTSKAEIQQDSVKRSSMLSAISQKIIWNMILTVRLQWSTRLYSESALRAKEQLAQ